MADNTSLGKKLNIFTCEKKLWLDLNCRGVSNPKSMDIAEDYAANSVKEFAYVSFAPSIKITSENQTDAVKETLSAISNRNERTIITDAAFSFGDRIFHIDRLLVKNDGAIEICDIKAATHIRDGFIKELAFKCAALCLLGFAVRKVYIRYINDSFVKNGPIDANKFFLHKDVTQDVLYYTEENIQNIKKVTEITDEPRCLICERCLSPYRCEYWNYCTDYFPENNVFDIAGLSMDRKFELFFDGILSFEDVEKSGKVSKRQMEQVMANLYSLPPKVDKNELRSFLSELTYPLYFLDFETFQSAIPRFDGVRPFTQIPFQYSLHYADAKGGGLCHKEFLADFEHDPRRALAVQLVNDIPIDACVLAYNMTFEKGVIRTLALMFNDLYDDLMRIHNNMRDLMVPFRKHSYYDRRMNGSHSLKAVLPALFPDDKELDYKNLDSVHNGLEAMIMYQQGCDADSGTRRNIRENLLNYCGLDTYAMVKILEKLENASV
ncbi:MAG: DUF2779 domain-containing protein [Ruminococcaceae bacterium]|nr:DUF2779 domain-containing protein [Oscillospiraceae bacterium]